MDIGKIEAVLEREIVLADYESHSDAADAAEIMNWYDTAVFLGYSDDDMLDLVELVNEISADLCDAIEGQENTYIVVVDPLYAFQFHGEKTALKFFDAFGNYLRSENSNYSDFDLKAFYLTDSSTYSEKEWSCLETIVDAELDFKNGSYRMR